MPAPKKRESKKDFISRCIEELVGKENYEIDQAAAICNSKWANFNDNVFELLVDDFTENTGVYAIGFVEEPAIEENFYYFKNDKCNYTLSKIDDEKHILIGPALIPHKQIYRYDKTTNTDYYVYFTPETIKLISEKFLRFGFNNEITEQHEKPINDIYLAESWIVENEQDKIITKYGYNVPIGTWCISYKVENEDIWNKIKNQEINGFSIEGRFVESFSIENDFEYQKKLQKINENLEKLIQKLYL